MQEELTRSLNAKDAALTKAQEEATNAAANADRAQQQAAEDIASANAKSEQECKRAQCAANREVDEYKERINKVRLTPATISVHAA